MFAIISYVMPFAMAHALYVYLVFAGIGILLLIQSHFSKKPARNQAKESKGTWGDVFRTFYWAIFIAMIVRTFIFQPFNVPSGSMKPTLLIGDYMIVSKYSYGYSNHSFPLSPDLFDGRKLYSEPQRGDIVVMHVPKQTIDKDTYVKRLIGLPGDEIQVKKGLLYINNKPVETEDAGTFNDRDGDIEIKQFVETLPNGFKHFILSQPKGYDGFYKLDADNTEVYKVPEGYYFMMGDNRDNSADSRFPTLGFVAGEDLIGRAEIVLFASGESWNPLRWDYARFFTLLR